MCLKILIRMLVGEHQLHPLIRVTLQRKRQRLPFRIHFSLVNIILERCIARKMLQQREVKIMKSMQFLEEAVRAVLRMRKEKLPQGRKDLRQMEDMLFRQNHLTCLRILKIM